MKKLIVKLLILSMILNTFVIPPAVFAASTPQADPDKNYIQTPATVKANTVFKLKLIGDRSSVLTGTVEDETKYCGIGYDWYKNGTFYDHGNTVTVDVNNLPKYTYACISKPGKYEIRAKFQEKRWGSQRWNSSIWSHIAIATKAIQVQGKTQFKPGSKGEIAKGNKGSKWLDHGADIGALPKVQSNRGYQFKGWYTKKTGGKKISSKTKVSFSSATKTYYAQYKKR